MRFRDELGLARGVGRKKKGRAEALPFHQSGTNLFAGVFLDYTELAIDVMADIAAFAELGIGLGGHVGHV